MMSGTLSNKRSFSTPKHKFPQFPNQWKREASLSPNLSLVIPRDNHLAVTVIGEIGL